MRLILIARRSSLWLFVKVVATYHNAAQVYLLLKIVDGCVHNTQIDSKE